MPAVNPFGWGCKWECFGGGDGRAGWDSTPYLSGAEVNGHWVVEN
jgi:hypothetical protein